MTTDAGGGARGSAGPRAAGDSGTSAARAGGPLVVLIGPPGAGKSTVGTMLAASLGVGFLDTDAVVEEEAGKPVGEIFISDGEPEFRKLERAAVVRTLAGHSGVVLALGSGAVLDPGTQRSLSGRRVVYLETGFATSVRRAGLDVPRPLLPVNPRAKLKELMEQRLPIYSSLATITVRTDDRDPQEIADEIAELITAQIAAEEGEGAGQGERPDPGQVSEETAR